MGAAVVVNLLIKQLIVTIDPALARMGQLRAPLVTLTIQGAVAAVIVFALVAWLLPRPIFWYRIISVVALLLSWIPDIALGLGGAPMMTAMQVVGAAHPAGPERRKSFSLSLWERGGVRAAVEQPASLRV